MQTTERDIVDLLLRIPQLRKQPSESKTVDRVEEGSVYETKRVIIDFLHFLLAVLLIPHFHCTKVNPREGEPECLPLC
jgi:hypothetical protein